MADSLLSGVGRLEVLDAAGRRIDWGTGFIAGDGVVLTAYHVSAKQRAAPFVPKGAVLQLVLTRLPEAPVLRVDCEPVDADPDLDFAVHRLLDPRPEAVRPVLCGADTTQGRLFRSFGFSKINPNDGLVFRGLVADADAALMAAPALQLFSEQAAGFGANLSGLSGGPVFDEDRVVGVVRAYPEQEGAAVAGTLYACPMQAILRRDKAGLRSDPCASLPALAANHPWPNTPYRDLLPYTPNDARVFYGRCHELERLGRALEDPSTRLILLVGRTGVGKSSLLHAGLVPRWRGQFDISYARRDEALGLARQLSELSEAKATPQLIILDQLEEALTRPRPYEDELAGLALAIDRHLETHPKDRVLLGFRKEWFEEITAALNQTGLGYRTERLRPLGAEAVQEVVLGPARNDAADRYGLKINQAVAQRIREALLTDGGATIAPQLQAILTRLWTDAGGPSADTKVFTVEAVDAVAREGLGLDRVLARRLEGIEPKGLALDLLEAHTTSHGTAAVLSSSARSARYAHLPESADAMVRALESEHLLVEPSEDEGVANDGHATRLAHDALGPHVLAFHRNSNEPGPRARRIVENRDKDAPLDEYDLGLVEQGQGQMRAWSLNETELVELSRRARIHAQAGRRRASIIRKTLVAGLGLAFLVAGGFWLQSTQTAGTLQAEVDKSGRREAARFFFSAQERLADSGDVVDGLRYTALAVESAPSGDPQAARYASRAIQLALAGPTMVGHTGTSSGTTALFGNNLFWFGDGVVRHRIVDASNIEAGLSGGPFRTVLKSMPELNPKSIVVAGGRFLAREATGSGAWWGPLRGEAPKRVPVDGCWGAVSVSEDGSRFLCRRDKDASWTVISCAGPCPAEGDPIRAIRSTRMPEGDYGKPPRFRTGSASRRISYWATEDRLLETAHDGRLSAWRPTANLASRSQLRCAPPASSQFQVSLRANKHTITLEGAEPVLKASVFDSADGYLFAGLAPSITKIESSQGQDPNRMVFARLSQGALLRLTVLFGELGMHVGPFTMGKPRLDGGSPLTRSELSPDGRLGVTWQKGVLRVWQNARQSPDAEITDEATWILDYRWTDDQILQACFHESEGATFVVADLADGTSAAVYVDEPLSPPPAWIPELASLTGQVRARNGALQAVPNYMNGPKRAKVMQAIRQDPSVGARLLCRHFELSGCKPLPDILQPDN